MPIRILLADDHGILRAGLRNLLNAEPGLDVIGDYLTEINITSPTGMRELDRQFGLNIAGGLFDAIDRHLRQAENRKIKRKK